MRVRVCVQQLDEQLLNPPTWKHAPALKAEGREADAGDGRGLEEREERHEAPLAGELEEVEHAVASKRTPNFTGELGRRQTCGPFCGFERRQQVAPEQKGSINWQSH